MVQPVALHQGPEPELAQGPLHTGHQDSRGVGLDMGGIIMDEITLIHGDCSEEMKKMPDKSVDLIVTDPPFDNSLSASMGAGIAKKRDYIKRLYREFASFDFKILEDTRRLMNIYNGYWFFNIKQLFPYVDFLRKHDYNYSLLTWHKRNPTPLLNNNYLPDTEYIFFIRDKGAYFKPTYETGKRYIETNVWKNHYDHPSAKPSSILRNYILNSSKENDTILDPFMGTGATGVACIELNRRFIGIEIKKEYYEIAKRRIANTQKSMF